MKISNDLTIELLHRISSRLSSRSDCKGVEYYVFILHYNDSLSTILFQPHKEVYPDMHSRKREQSDDIIKHVLSKYFADLYYDTSDDGSILVYSKYFTPGVYKYELSYNGKYRRWMRQY